MQQNIFFSAAGGQEERGNFLLQEARKRDLELDGRKKEDEKEDEEDLMIAGHAKLFARTEEVHMPLLQLLLQQQQQIEHKIAKLLTRLPA